MPKAQAVSSEDREDFTDKHPYKGLLRGVHLCGARSEENFACTLRMDHEGVHVRHSGMRPAGDYWADYYWVRGN